MNVPTRLAAFAAVLALAFGGAALAGAAIDPTDAPPTADAHASGEEGEAHGSTASDDRAHSHGTATGDDEHDHGSGSGGDADEHGAGGHTSSAPAGLAVADGGYALEVDRTRLPRGSSTPLRFRITDDRGRVVRDEFRVEHEKELHLIVVGRDTKVFQHVHPTRGPDGTWTAEIDTTTAGVHRVYADFRLGDGKHVLATDLFVPGPYRPAPLPAPRTTDRAVEPDGRPSGVDVTLRAPTLRAGRESVLSFSAGRADGAAARLEPYLGADGHLVALRTGDLAYLHVHPTGDPDGRVPANAVRFAATFPTAGRYRLFLQVRIDGRVRTVDFTVGVAR
jgi:hypothetical protein